MEEIWKDISGYQGLYQVSNTGKVKSLERITTFWNNYKVECKRAEPEKLMQPSKKQRYELISIQKLGIKKSFMVHRLVASHFLLNPQNKPYINHKDGNGKNNNADNLEWCTASENMKHAWATGLQPLRPREKYINNLIKHSYVQCTCTGTIYTTNDAAKIISVSNAHLLRMVYGTRTNWTQFISYEARNME
ncbi:MAG: NUMOD4 domain-containing protein [Bacteroidota bacterium]